MRTIRAVALALAVAGGWATSGWCAEAGSMKDLPTLLIKGEVVSVDANDPAATLLKVKDRYGFETPIFITPDTKVLEGDHTLPSSSLQTGKAVEVEYSFDINTAKRYAVSVKLPAPSAESAAPSSTPAAPVTGTASPSPSPASVPSASSTPATPPAAAPSGAEATPVQPSAPAEGQAQPSTPEPQ